MWNRNQESKKDMLCQYYVNHLISIFLNTQFSYVFLRDNKSLTEVFIIWHEFISEKQKAKKLEGL